MTCELSGRRGRLSAGRTARPICLEQPLSPARPRSRTERVPPECLDSSLYRRSSSVPNQLKWLSSTRRHSLMSHINAARSVRFRWTKRERWKSSDAGLRRYVSQELLRAETYSLQSLAANVAMEVSLMSCSSIGLSLIYELQMTPSEGVRTPPNDHFTRSTP